MEHRGLDKICVLDTDGINNLHACAVCSNFTVKNVMYARGTIPRKTTNYTYCDIILHPSDECDLEPSKAAIGLIHHEILHYVLKTIVGERANHKWDNIAGDLTGCPCNGVV